MDQKSTATLDPKLKEVYDRVMGSSAQPSAPITATPPTSTNPPLVPPSTPPTIGLTPPLAVTPSAPEHTSMIGTLPPLPEHPGSPAQMTPPLTPPAAAPKPTVDYAAIAAKYATPLPSINSSMPQRPTGQAAVTPSSTTYGVVNGGSTTAKEETPSTEKSGSSLKKILLIVGIPLFIVAYATVWIVVFKVDVMSFLPLPK